MFPDFRGVSALFAKFAFVTLAISLCVLPTSARGAEPAKGDPKCAILFPTGYSVSVSEYQGACVPARTLWLHKKDGNIDRNAAELVFWRDSEAPGGLPVITEDKSHVFHAELLLSDFEAIYGILKMEKSVMVVFECDGHGGYKGIHVSGGHDEPTLRNTGGKLLELKKRPK